MKLSSLSKNIYIIIFILFNSVLVAQSAKVDYCKFRENYNKAKMYVYNKRYKEARNLYEAAFKHISEKYAINLGYEDYVTCLLYDKDTAAAIRAEERYLAIGDVYMFSENFIINKFGEKYGVILYNKFPEIKLKHESTISENERSLNELEKRDQNIRSNKNKMSHEKWVAELEYTDSTNFYELFQLVKNKNADPTACFLMIHMYGKNEKYFSFYDSIFRFKISVGEASAEAYVQWFDRQRMDVDNMKTQLYGEWNEGVNKGFNQIEDIANVDKRRSELGLCPLGDYAILHGLALPPGYIKSKKKRVCY